MQQSPRPRTPITLSASLLHQLNLYALAASAVGLGALSLASPVEAKVIYKHAHKQIAPNNTVPLDVNQDGKIDFNIHDSFTCTSFCEYIVGAITAEPVRPANEIVGRVGRSHHSASALSAGFRIGPKGPFLKGNEVMAFGGYDAGTTSVGYCAGAWDNVAHRYLGLKFTIAGKIHYGWASLNETCAKNGKNTAVLTGYAYETVANKPILAGKKKNADVTEGVESASLGRLSQGSRGLAVWRSGK